MLILTRRSAKSILSRWCMNSLLFLPLLFISTSSFASDIISIPNPSFETPAIPFDTGGHYAPSGASWTFDTGQNTSTGYKGSGIAFNGGAFMVGIPPAPDGNQVAFLQGTGAISQVLSGFEGTKQYAVSFYAAQRAEYNTSQSIAVYIDGTLLGTFTPPSTSWTKFKTNPFTAATGSHTLTLAGLNPGGGDNCALVDAVSATNTALVYTKINPSTVTAGSSDIHAVVTGLNFTNSCVVLWNRSTPLSTAFVSPTELHVVIPAALIAAPTRVDINIRDTTTGHTSNAHSFMVILTSFSIAVGTVRRMSDGTITIPVMLTNTGYNAANNLAITAATYNGMSCLNSFPIPLGSVPAYYPASTLIGAPAATPSGASVPLSLTGTFDGGTFTLSKTVTAP